MIGEDSPILDFYPPDFEIDMNGKKMAWQGIALLPFISQDRLLGAIATVEPLLTPDEKRRNTIGDNVMLISDDNDLYPKFCELYTKKKATRVSLQVAYRSVVNDIWLANPAIIRSGRTDRRQTVKRYLRSCSR
jgi:5'-3' exonuclease